MEVRMSRHCAKTKNRANGVWLLALAVLIPWAILVAADLRYGSVPKAAPCLTLMTGILAIAEILIVCLAVIGLCMSKHKLYLLLCILALLSTLCFFAVFFSVLWGGLP